MGTVVTIQVARRDVAEDTIGGALDRAFSWFHEIEERCTRFDAASELMRLCATTGEWVPVSAIVFEAVRFALAVAEQTGGVFDPTVGGRMRALGYDQHHRSGARVTGVAEDGVNFRDVEVDEKARALRLRRRLTLDAGAVAKGLAIDMAAREMEGLRDFSIDAGGDLFLSGLNDSGEAWRVGIRHPRTAGALIARLRVSGLAVCTSGDYERGQHILNGHGGALTQGLVSVTAIGPGAMLADAMSTAAFAAGPRDGLALLEQAGLEGLLITDDLQWIETRGLRKFLE